MCWIATQDLHPDPTYEQGHNTNILNRNYQNDRLRVIRMVYELLTAIYGEWISRILLEHVNTRVIYCYPENLTGMLYMDKNVCNAIYTNVHK